MNWNCRASLLTHIFKEIDCFLSETWTSTKESADLRQNSGFTICKAHCPHALKLADLCSLQYRLASSADLRNGLGPELSKSRSPGLSMIFTLTQRLIVKKNRRKVVEKSKRRRSKDSQEFREFTRSSAHYRTRYVTAHSSQRCAVVFKKRTALPQIRANRNKS